MDFQIFFSSQAVGDLEQIVSYVARHNSDAAGRLGNQLVDAALTLTSQVERGRIVPEFKRPDLREIIFRSYRIIYRIGKGQTVEIVRFWHGARGFPQIPRA